MNSPYVLAFAALLTAPIAAPPQADQPAAYLNKDGQLTHALTIEFGALQIFAPPGDSWTIEPDGRWRRDLLETHGQLAPKQLAALAQHLSAQGFGSLPDVLGFKDENASHDFVRIQFGKKAVEFRMAPGKTQADYLPEKGDPNPAAWSRFVALELVLTDLLDMAEARKTEP